MSSASDGSIWALFVQPGHEGLGIGQALLAHACDTARSAGFRTATLTTAPGTRAERLYRKAQWIEVGRTSYSDVVFERAL